MDNIKTEAQKNWETCRKEFNKKSYDMSLKTFDAITRKQELDVCAKNILQFEEIRSLHDASYKYTKNVYKSIHETAKPLIEEVGEAKAFKIIENSFPPYLNVLFDQNKKITSLDITLTALAESVNNRMSINDSNYAIQKLRKEYLEALFLRAYSVLTLTEVEQFNEFFKENEKIITNVSK